MNIKYKIKRKIVRYNQRSIEKSDKRAFKNISIEQKQAFEMVKDIAIKNNSAIKFDPASDEILIILPKMLITLKNQNIEIHNTTGFINMNIPYDTYSLLVKIITKEAHKERRRLKHEVNLRIQEFLSKISENN